MGHTERNLFIMLLILVSAASVCTAESVPSTPRPYRSAVLELLARYAQVQAATTSIRAETRIVHLPQDRSIGRAYIVEPQFDKKPLHHYVLGWPNRMIPEVRGEAAQPCRPEQFHS